MQTLHVSIYEQSLYCDNTLLSITDFLKPNPYFRNVDKMQLCNHQNQNTLLTVFPVSDDGQLNCVFSSPL